MKNIFLLSTLLSLCLASCSESSDMEDKNESTPETTVDTTESNVSSDFEPEIPDTSMLKSTWRESNYHESLAYLYLSEHYKPTSEKDSVRYYGEDSDMICSYVQTFENGIKYATNECSEEGGATEVIYLPATDLKKVQELVELLFYDPWNEWQSEYLYAPDDVGCYYTIKQEKERTIIDIYCGC